MVDFEKFYNKNDQISTVNVDRDFRADEGSVQGDYSVKTRAKQSIIFLGGTHNSHSAISETLNEGIGTQKRQSHCDFRVSPVSMSQLLVQDKP